MCFCIEILFYKYINLKKEYMIEIYKITIVKMIEYMNLSSIFCGQSHILGH